MKTMMSKYASQLELIKDELDYNRKWAIKRFFLLMDFENRFIPLQKKLLGNKYSRTKALKAYSILRHKALHTFRRWIVMYRKEGIKGLVPKFGQRGHPSQGQQILETMKLKYASQLKLIDSESDYSKFHAAKRFILLKNFENVFSSLRQKQHVMKFLKSKPVAEYCKSHHISAHSIYRWSIVYRKFGIKGLLFNLRSEDKAPLYQQRKNKLIVTLTIDVKKPLKCLEVLQQIIEHCDLIQPEIKNNSLALLSHYSIGLRAGSRLHLKEPLTEKEIKTLNRYKAGKHKWYTKRATVILMANEGRTLLETMEATHMPKGTIYRRLRNFNKDHLESIKVHVHAPGREKAKAERQTRVIDIIHKMPSLYGINRTTWTYGTIAEAYEKEYGAAISKEKVQGVIHDTDYTWRHARKVLTSPDPDYKAKVEKLIDTLQGLQEGERFFFIDEVGPYRVKKYGGRVLIPKDQTPEIPEYQKSRGKIQFVAALEAVTNQMLWFFSPDKTAASMIRLFEKIALEYADCPNAFFTWDAISVHNSKLIVDWIAAHNKTGKGPHIEIVPLPSKSQFLNVIEAVFGGMKKAVICNSDYL